MRCMICWQCFDCSGPAGPKLDTIKKHHKRKHEELKGYKDSRKKMIIRKYTKQIEEAQKDVTNPTWLTKVCTVQTNMCDCERGFSVLIVKNEYRSCLTREHTNACMSVGMEESLVDVFPFVKLRYVWSRD